MYLAHESQFPNPGDFVTAPLGRQPVIVTRNKSGEVRGLHQRLRPPRRGAVPRRTAHRKLRPPSVAPATMAGATTSTAKSIGVKEKNAGGYPPSFDGGPPPRPDAAGQGGLLPGLRLRQPGRRMSPRWRSTWATLAGSSSTCSSTPRRRGWRRCAAPPPMPTTATGRCGRGEQRGRLPRRPPRTGTTPPPRRAAARASRTNDDQGARRRQLGQVRRRLLVLPQRPPVPVDLGGEPAGPPAVGHAWTS